MKTCVLTGKTQKGKNRIFQHGNIWEISKEEENVLIIKSINKTFNNNGIMEHDMRVVNRIDDLNFEINSIQ